MTERNETAPPPEPAAPAAALDRPRLKKLVIHRYRHVKPGATLLFDDTWNVIVGKNGTGKTTLLKLIEKLLVYRPEGLERDPLNVYLEMSIGRGTLTTHIEWNCSPPMRRPDVLPGDEPDLKVTGSFDGEGCRVTWERQPFTFTTNVEGGDFPRFHGRPYLPPHTLLGVFLPRLGTVSVSTPRIDEALGFFDQLTRWTLSRNQSDHGVIVSSFDFVPHSKRIGFLGRDMDPHAAVVWRSDEDAMLRTFETLAAVGEGKCTLPSKRVDVEDDEIRSIHGPLSFTFTRESGSSFGHNDLSFGQKRLLAFLYYLEMNAPIVLVDELSNGFHRNWIDYAVEQMQTRQNFAATQNPLLLDRIPFHSPEELQRSLIFCREEDGKFVWENAKADDMQEVYDAYDVGLEKVSDLLWRKGMW